MIVRLALARDIPAVAQINDWYIGHSHAHFAVEPVGASAMFADWSTTARMHPWLVAQETGNGPLIGFARSSPWKGRCAYAWTAETSVYVVEQQHGRGIGRALYSGLFDILRKQGYRTLIAGIALPNDPSIKLHESLGMRKVAHLGRVGWKFEKWWDVAYWQVDLVEGESAPGELLTVAEATGESVPDVSAGSEGDA